eukprot:TRINITY_DN115_c0_g2_i1.p1 TRINITY_DN115_c0_g2~~TRINITY_DN115_c0_g2_i1.p1  ORF type:complete len:184 (-),score=38.11 TRINITY_DN115_c0_g2_i1:85-636(-)
MGLSDIVRGNHPGASPRFPVFFKGLVTKGFGRGAKQLGCPTANIPPEPYADYLTKQGVVDGVYYGLACVYPTAASLTEGSSGGKDDHGKVYGMAMNIGYVPYFQNTVLSMEVHLFHDFADDFYGHELRVIGLGYIRPEASFNNIDELIQAIQDDISYSKDRLEEEENKSFVDNEFFSPSASGD